MPNIQKKSSASILLLLSLFSLINIPQSSAAPAGMLIQGWISGVSLDSIINSYNPVSDLSSVQTTEFSIDNVDAFNPSGSGFIASEQSAPITVKKLVAGSVVSDTTFNAASPYASERIFDRDIFIVQIDSNLGMRYYSFTAVIDFPEVTIDPVSFPNQEVGTFGTQDVLITNTGVGLLSIGMISSSNISEWTVIGGGSCEYANIQPNAQCTFQVMFSPYFEGYSDTTISIENYAGSAETLYLSATGFSNGGGPPTFPAIAFSPVIFPDTQVGSNSSQTITVSNIGDGDLVIGQVTTDNASFAIGIDFCSNETISPTSTCDVEVIFYPFSFNSENANVSFPSNTGFNDYVMVTASGVSPPPTYTVTYHATNSDNSAVTSGTPPVDVWSPYTEGLTVNAEYNSNLTLSGYSFLGWCTDFSNSEPTSCITGVILPGEVITSFIMNNIDLYPVWQENVALTISIPTVSATAYKGIALTVSVQTSGPGKILFLAQGKRISSCLARPTTGSAAPYTATCSWKPSVTGYRRITAKLTPTNTSYSVITSSPQNIFVQRRTTLR